MGPAYMPRQTNVPFPQYDLVFPEFRQLQYPDLKACNLVQFFTGIPDAWLWLYFARPDVHSRRIQTYYPPQHSPKRNILERLPLELLEDILDFLLTSKTDMIALGLSSRPLWPIILQRIHREYEKEGTAPHAGRKVAFQGYKSRLKEGFGDYPWPDLGAAEIILPSPTERWLKQIDTLRFKWSGFTTHDWTAIEKDLSQMYLYPKDKVWVLRNLSKQQLIRSDKLLPIRGSGPDLRFRFLYYWRRERRYIHKTQRASIQSMPGDKTPLTLAQVFLCAVCWDDDIDGREDNYHFQRGPWCGSRIDLVTLEAHEAELNMKEWSDVSGSIVENVGNLRSWVRYLGDAPPRALELKYSKLMRRDREKHDFSI